MYDWKRSESTQVKIAVFGRRHRTPAREVGNPHSTFSSHSEENSSVLDYFSGGFW